MVPHFVFVTFHNPQVPAPNRRSARETNWAAFFSLFAITQSKKSSVTLVTTGSKEDTQSEG